MTSKNASSLSQHSLNLQGEDWDQSMSQRDFRRGADVSSASVSTPLTPQNSVVFPAEDTERTLGKVGLSQGKRSLSELLRLHAAKGTDVKCSAEDASSLAEVLGQWINSGSSPYEAEDDFFARPHDDLSIPNRLPTRQAHEPNGRPRGQSESCVGPRPPSSAGLDKR